MSHLILIRHSISHQQSAVSSDQWTLTPEGITLCSVLAQYLQAYQPSKIYSSTEPKAVLTASSLAEHLMSRCEVASVDGLEETHRKTVPYYKNGDDFRAAVIAAMHQPDEVLFGEESFTMARQRFENTLQTLMARHPDETVAAVSHGTVMSLWLAPMLQRPVEDVWKSMGMPAYAIIEWPQKHVIHFQETLE
jgi:broad specificity phosphatase PhoE